MFLKSTCRGFSLCSIHVEKRLSYPNSFLPLSRSAWELATGLGIHMEEGCGWVKKDIHSPPLACKDSSLPQVTGCTTFLCILALPSSTGSKSIGQRGLCQCYAVLTWAHHCLTGPGQRQQSVIKLRSGDTQQSRARSGYQETRVRHQVTDRRQVAESGMKWGQEP